MTQMTNEEFCELFAEKLARKHQRLTPQRRAVADVLCRQDAHLNVDELHALVRQEHPTIGYATVYRTMKLLEEHALVSVETFHDGTARYEVSHGVEHHDHLVCLTCGAVIEFEHEQIERLQDEVAKQHGFKLESHKMVLYGRCQVDDCATRHQADTIKALQS